ncbi:MAG: hypothetical protein HY482_00945 [Candidatus Wildermuthbacteria bacterium]|nr:hypothetical protein [Candidatus Wildermuthbacteria bacterium]
MQENQNNNSSPSFEPENTRPETPAFLKREEVRTMAKDIAAIGEQEARMEQERIAQLQKESTAARGPMNPPSLSSPQATLAQATPPPPIQQRKPPGGSDKLIVRMIAGGIVLFFVLNLGALGFWYFTSKDQKNPVVVMPETEDNTAPAPEPQTTPEPPPSLTPILKTQAIVLDSSQELLAALESILKGSAPQGLSPILASPETRADEILEGLGMRVPPEVRTLLTNNLQLFLHAGGEKNRPGVIFETNKQDAQASLKNWELSLEQDTERFFSAIGQKGSAYTAIFRSGTYKQTIPYRFQTFSVLDFGIVYGTIDNYIILASSLEGFQRAADALTTTIQTP